MKELFNVLTLAIFGFILSSLIWALSILLFYNWFGVIILVDVFNVQPPKITYGIAIAMYMLITLTQLLFTDYTKRDVNPDMEVATQQFVIHITYPIIIMITGIVFKLFFFF
jgi:uncharacterized membrane protein YeiB